MHVLLVEDEDAIRSALARGLTAGGNTVDAAATLAEGRAKAAARPPDALVTDLKLPDGLGLDLAEELGVPFVQMTGYGTFDDAVRAIRLGCVEFFTKPVALRDLRSALDRVARRRALGGPGGGALVLDPERGVSLRIAGDRSDARPLFIAAAQWADPAGAAVALQRLREAAPCLRQRQLLAELARLVPAGRLVVNRDDQQWCAWLDTGDLIPDGRDHGDVRTQINALAARATWLMDGGVVVETLAQLPPPSPVAEPNPSLTVWRGAAQPDELLWPQELPAGSLIDLSGVAAVGTWTHEWFRAHPGQAVVGARPEVRRQLESAGLPVLFKDPRFLGVTAQEKADLYAGG